MAEYGESFWIARERMTESEDLIENQKVPVFSLFRPFKGGQKKYWVGKEKNWLIILISLSLLR